MARSVEIHNNQRFPLHLVVKGRNHHACAILDKGIIGMSPNFVTMSAADWTAMKAKNAALQQLEDERGITVKNVGGS